jgi:hypothetical protein
VDIVEKKGKKGKKGKKEVVLLRGARLIYSGIS